MLTGIRTVVVLGAAATLAACSSSGSRPTPPSPTPLSTAKAQQLAAAGVLKSSDLTGYASKAQTHSASDVAMERAVRTCLGIPAAHYLARNFGTAFTRTDLEIDSSADVVASAADAQQDLHALSGSRAPGCLQQTLRQAAATGGASASSLSVTPTNVSVPGSDAAFGYRLSVDVTAGTQSVRITGYDIGALVGQVEINLSIEATGPTAFTLSQGVALATTATARVRAVG